MGRTPALISTGVLAWLVSVGCYGPPRPQVLVLVTTDLATPADVATDPSILGTATIDHVRAEVLASDGTVVTSKDFAISNSVEFPLSFGIEATAGVPVLVRVTGYRGVLAVARDGLNSPPVLASVTRLVRASAGDNQVKPVSVVLRGDCLALSDDASKVLTCARTPSDDANTDDSGDPRKPATWSGIRSVACASAAPTGLTCIAGGLADLGAPDLASVDPGSGFVPSPPRLAKVSPFFIDTEEMTLGLFRSVYTHKQLTVAKPTDLTTDARCNYSDAIGTHELEAVRCVSSETARAVCRARGSDLPTLAQWEYAARGRSRSSRYPWGDESPACCTAALASIDVGLGCQPLLNVGTYAKQRCKTHDVSPDGVRDLGGSVREWVLDAAISTALCGGPGVMSDAACVAPGMAQGSTKGGSFLTPLEGASSALRREAGVLTDVGFRCVR